MAMTQIELMLPAEGLDAWGDALLEAGAVSVSIEDQDSATEDEVAVYGEPGMPPPAAGWRNNRVSVLLDADLDADRLLAEAAAALGTAVPPVLSREPVAERDWVRQTQAQFTPVRIGAAGRVWIVPSWHEPPDPDACNIRIDPGVAFGTGTHPTTRLCLAWIDANLAAGSRVLDYGCGSGILSICAARLGAGEVTGVDIDPQALVTARDNARRNGVRAQYTGPEALATAPDPEADPHAGRGFDLVVANILANPIMLLAPTLVHHLGPGGTLLLSGILERQAESVIAAFRAVDARLELAAVGADEGWVALAGRRAG
jgi:ribosomal protein L11 methyltransferase